MSRFVWTLLQAIPHITRRIQVGGDLEEIRYSIGTAGSTQRQP
jgi:hypothetical protein